MEKVKHNLTASVECDACNASGVYSEFAEPKGVGVVCLDCNGSGKLVVKFKLFKSRKKRKDIKYVELSQGKFLPTGVGSVKDCNRISYEEFLAGKFPKKKR